MRKRVSGLILCFVLLFALPLPAFAANQVHTMDIQAVLYEDGSMHITQNWEGRFEEVTESYIPMNAPDYLTISELTVSDQNGIYDTVPDWNIDWSFEEKARKCGIHDTDGPRFDNNRPDVNDYIRSYQRSIEELEKLVAAFKTVAFLEAPEQSIGLGAVGAQAVHTTTAPPADAIEEIKKYKTLMEEGIISQQEFDAKKRQLLGI
ncbi:hypothetical protein JCM14036_25030 [Desulfotomaculum defluvii]